MAEAEGGGGTEVDACSGTGAGEVVTRDNDRRSRLRDFPVLPFEACDEGIFCPRQYDYSYRRVSVDKASLERVCQNSLHYVHQGRLSECRMEGWLI